MRAHVRYGLREIATQITSIEAPEWRERRRPVTSSPTT
jgi:hypothetical protein